MQQSTARSRKSGTIESACEADRNSESPGIVITVPISLIKRRKCPLGGI